MKRTASISILLNTLLLCAVIWLIREQRSILEKRANQPEVKSTAPIQSTVRSFDWRMVESEDYRTYIANLRSVGCPEETIRDIIVADVNKLFESRRRALISTNEFQYWKLDAWRAMWGLERVEKLQALAKEKRELLKELLGSDAELPPETLTQVYLPEDMLSFLSASKQTAVNEIRTHYQAKLQAIYLRGRSAGDALKEFNWIKKEMEAALAAALTPDEFEQYQLRASDAAAFLRDRLSAFDPTEQEFREIFRIKKQLDDDNSRLENETGQPTNPNIANNQLDSELKQALGETRYADYERSQDWNYRQLCDMAERYNLPKETSGQIFQMQRAARKAAQDLLNNQTLSREQRAVTLEQLQKETENSVRTALGNQAWEHYRQQPESFWVKSPL